MDELGKYFAEVTKNLMVLRGDLRKMSSAKPVGAKGKEEDKKEKEKVQVHKSPTTVLHPMTRLRKDQRAIKEAKANPQLTFIQDRLNDIFK